MRGFSLSYVVIGVIILCSCDSFRDTTPPTLEEIKLRLKDTGISRDYVNPIYEGGGIKIPFSHVPRDFSYSTKFVGIKGGIRYWDDEEIDVGEFPDETLTTEANWSGNVLELSFTDLDHEPIWNNSLLLKLEYSAYAEYEDTKFSLEPDEKNALAYTELHFKFVLTEMYRVSTTIEPYPAHRTDGRLYFQMGEPFRVIIEFDRPAPGVQLWKGSFRVCRGTYGDVLWWCPIMELQPLVQTWRDGKNFIVNFPFGLASPASDVVNFHFDVVWAGDFKWWKTDVTLTVDGK